MSTVDRVLADRGTGRPLTRQDLADRDRGLLGLLGRDLADRDLADLGRGTDRGLADRDLADRDMGRGRDLADRDLGRYLADRGLADRDLADRDLADRCRGALTIGVMTRWVVPGMRLAGSAHATMARRLRRQREGSAGMMGLLPVGRHLTGTARHPRVAGTVLRLTVVGTTDGTDRTAG